MARLTAEQQAQFDSLKALQSAPETEPDAEPTAATPDVEARVHALEVTLGHPADESKHRLVTLAKPRRVVDAAVEPLRVSFVASPITGQRTLVFDGKPCPKGVVVVDGVRCYLELGADTEAAKAAPEADA